MAQISSTPPMTLGDLIRPETKRHPAAFYAHLRKLGPLTRIVDSFGSGDAWIVTHYDDVVAVLKDPRFVKDTRKYTRSQAGQSDSAEAADSQTSRAERFAWRRDMLTTDPPDHTRLRQLVSKAFTPRMIEQLRPRIQQIADALIDAVEARGEMDLIADFALPLPITVISEMLGIPEADRHQFRTWTQVLINSSVGADQAASIAAEEAFLQYLKDLVASKRAKVGDDLISDMLQVEEQGDALSEYELISTIWLLIIAGHETTVNLIGNGMLALLEHPDQLHLLQHDPSLIVSAVEELLRYTAPLNFSTVRWAGEDVPIGDKVIHKGEPVFISFSAANIDSQQFHHPEVLDITRQENQHLAFGKGIHSCLGTSLARLEGQIAFGTLLRRLPDLRLACSPEQLTWTPSFQFHELTSLPVTFKGR